MRNIILSIVFLLYGYTAFTQVVIPVEKAYHDVKNNPSKVYKQLYWKDVNNILNKYEGEWEGIYNNKAFYFKISKQIKVSSPYSTDFSEDLLNVKYIITDYRTGKVLQDKFKVSTQQLSRGMPEFLTENSYPLNYYADTKEQIGCGDRGLMLLSYDPKNKLKVHVIPRQVTYIVIEGNPDPCDGVSVDLPFPRTEDKAMTLTKKK